MTKTVRDSKDENNLIQTEKIKLEDMFCGVYGRNLSQIQDLKDGTFYNEFKSKLENTYQEINDMVLYILLEATSKNESVNYFFVSGKNLERDFADFVDKNTAVVVVIYGKNEREKKFYVVSNSGHVSNMGYLKQKQSQPGEE